VPLTVPRDRAGTFEPLLIPKRAGRIAGGLDDMIISLYAHGMSVRDHPAPPGAGLRHPAVPRDRLADHRRRAGGGRARQARPLDPVYAVVFLDAIVVKVHDNHVVQNKPAYVAVGIDADVPGDVITMLAHARSENRVAEGAEPARAYSCSGVSADLRLPDGAVHGDNLSSSSEDGLLTDTASIHTHGNRTAVQLAAESFPCTAADAVMAVAAAGTHAEQPTARKITTANARRPGRSV
jgi:hypothetical protein